MELEVQADSGRARFDGLWLIVRLPRVPRRAISVNLTICPHRV
jgi:hypothetical protein